MSDKNVLIQVTDLKKHYNKGEIKALDGVSLEIDQGEVVVIIGPSGSGKSTLLRSLNLLEGTNQRTDPCGWRGYHRSKGRHQCAQTEDGHGISAF